MRCWQLRICYLFDAHIYPRARAIFQQFICIPKTAEAQSMPSSAVSWNRFVFLFCVPNFELCKIRQCVGTFLLLFCFKWVIGKLCLWERFARGQPADFEVLMTTAMKCDSIRRGRPQIQVKGVINLANFKLPIRARIKTMRFECWWTSVRRAANPRKIWTFWVTDKESARSLNPIKDPYCQCKNFRTVQLVFNVFMVGCLVLL